MLALVTDSTCGLTRNEAAELGVDVLPMGYAAAGIRHAEGFVGENGDYAPALAGGGLVTTEAVRPSAFERAFRRHLDAGNGRSLPHDLLAPLRSVPQRRAGRRGRGRPARDGL